MVSKEFLCPFVMFGFIKKKSFSEKNGAGVGIERVMVGAGQGRSFDATRMKIKQLLMKVGKQRGKQNKKVRGGDF